MVELNFKTAFKYPFNRAKGMLNILWILLPIIGWFALGGFIVRIVKEFLKGKYKKLPEFSFKSDLKLGFFMFLKALPFFLGYMILIALLTFIHPSLELISYLIEFFVIPILTLNFIKKESISSYFEFEILKNVFSNFWEYVVAMIMDLLLFLVFLIMAIILIGIPAMTFTHSIFLANFYRKNIK